MYTGGVNYFPFYPTNKSIDDLDELLKGFADGEYSVSLRVVVKLLEGVGSECDDWNGKAFIGFVNTFIADNPLAQGTLIVRRNRDIRGMFWQLGLRQFILPVSVDSANISGWIQPVTGLRCFRYPTM